MGRRKWEWLPQLEYSTVATYLFKHILNFMFSIFILACFLGVVRTGECLEDVMEKKQNRQMVRYIRISHYGFVFLVVVTLLFSLFPQFAHAQTEVNLAWDANPETDQVSGYKVYYKTVSRGEPYNGTGADQGDSPITLLIEDMTDPDNPEFTLTGLDDNEVYFFVITAFNGYGESD